MKRARGWAAVAPLALLAVGCDVERELVAWRDPSEAKAQEKA